MIEGEVVGIITKGETVRVIIEGEVVGIITEGKTVGVDTEEIVWKLLSVSSVLRIRVVHFQSRYILQVTHIVFLLIRT